MSGNRYLSVWTCNKCRMSCVGTNSKPHPPNEPRHCRFVVFGHPRGDNHTYFPVLQKRDGSLRLLRLSDQLEDLCLLDDYLASARAKVFRCSDPAVAFHNAAEFSVNLSQSVSGYDYVMSNVIWKRLGGDLKGLSPDDKSMVDAIRQSRRRKGDGMIIWKWNTHGRKWCLCDGR